MDAMVDFLGDVPAGNTSGTIWAIVLLVIAGIAAVLVLIGVMRAVRRRRRVTDAPVPAASEPPPAESGDPG